MCVKDNTVFVLESWETHDGHESQVWKRATLLQRFRCWCEWFTEFLRCVASLGRDHCCAVHRCGFEFWLRYPVWLSCEFDHGSGDKCQWFELRDYLEDCRMWPDTVVISHPSGRDGCLVLTNHNARRVNNIGLMYD